MARRPAPGSLAGLRVLDLSRVLAGPWCTQLLADLGAEVVKIERPGSGDDTRHWGPPFLGPPSAGLSAYFLCANRNKRSVAIDFGKSEGAALVRRLAAISDVVVENFRPGSLRRFGLDYASLRAVRTDLVYCSITGFGQHGPDRDRGGYDLLIQAVGGLMSVTGEREGPPLKAGVAITDVMTGLYSAVGILAALRHRDATGEGQYIDIALADVQVATLANQALNYLVSGAVPGRLGNAHPNIVPYQAFRASDGHLVIAVGNDEQFRNLCRALDVPDLGGDPRFATNAARVAQRRKLLELLVPLVASRKRDEWIGLLERSGVPCGPVHDIAEVFADPQTQARGMKTGIASRDGEIPQVGNPLNMNLTPPRYQRPPPRLGTDTYSVLTELLNLEPGSFAALAESGIVSGKEAP
jgi:glutaryl-CoA transferase